VSYLEGIAAFALGLLGVWLVLVALLWIHRPTRALALPILRLIPDVIVLTRRLLADRSLPLAPRLALVGLLGWLLMPIDLIPDFVPVIGLLDDVVVTGLVLRWVARRLGPDALADRWPGPPESFELLRRLIT
jgi:uncharacterized membrane protein YkvA (DUF1232 family)